LSALHSSTSKLRLLRSACFISFAACGFALLFFPVRSREDGALANLTITFYSEAQGPGLYPDRNVDLPTGSLYYDVPVWALDLALFGLSAVSFAGLCIGASRHDAQQNPVS
jgi:hypothetical protein